MKTYFLYILYSQSADRFYIGISHDPETRLHYHNNAKKGYTRRGRPWKLMFKKPFPKKTQAMKWERWIKDQKDRALIQRIIAGHFEWK